MKQDFYNIFAQPLSRLRLILWIIIPLISAPVAIYYLFNTSLERGENLSLYTVIQTRFFLYSLTGLALVFWLFAEKKQKIIIILSSILSMALVAGAGAYFTDFKSAAKLAVHGLRVYPLAVCLIIAVVECLRRPESGKAFLRFAGEFAIIPMLAFTSVFSGHVICDLAANTYDYALLRFDESLGLPLYKILGEIVHSSRVLKVLTQAPYSSILIGVMLCQYLQKTRPKAGSVDIINIFVLSLALGLLGYALLPACGPYALLGKEFFMQAMPQANPGLLPEYTFAPRNAMPSLHFTWALLLFINAYTYGFLSRMFFLALLVMTFIATLGLGEHYFIDLVVAFAFSLMIQGICARQFKPAIAGFIMTALWYIFLMLGAGIYLSTPALSWVLIGATIGAVLNIFIIAFKSTH